MWTCGSCLTNNKSFIYTNELDFRFKHYVYLPRIRAFFTQVKSSLLLFKSYNLVQIFTTESIQFNSCEFHTQFRKCYHLTLNVLLGTLQKIQIEKLYSMRHVLNNSDNWTYIFIIFFCSIFEKNFVGANFAVYFHYKNNCWPCFFEKNVILFQEECINGQGSWGSTKKNDSGCIKILISCISATMNHDKKVNRSNPREDANCLSVLSWAYVFYCKMCHKKILWYLFTYTYIQQLDSRPIQNWIHEISGAGRYVRSIEVRQINNTRGSPGKVGF